MQPTVSVIMPAYNCELYIREAIDSILNQTYSHLELIIINDASTDRTLSIIESINDPRIRILNNRENSGISKSLNRGIDHARGKYIARMDADDCSLPRRIEKQVAFMEKHTDIALCGTFAKTHNSRKTLFHFSEDSYLKSLLLFYSPIIHPTAMLRKDILQEMKYKEEYNFCEDYDLWLRISKQYRIANIPQILLLYRVYEQSVTFTKAEIMSKRRLELICEELKELGITPTPEELQIHDKIANVYSLHDQLDKSYLTRLALWFQKLIEANNKTKKYPKHSFTAVVVFRWFLSCLFIKNYREMLNWTVLKTLNPASALRFVYLVAERIKFKTLQLPK